MLLALDRSGPVSSAAVFDQERALVASVRMPASGRGDAWPLVRDALAAARVSPRDLSEFAVGTGPGSFSGVRSAIAIASGLAAPDGLPVHGVVSAAALLRLWRRENPDAPKARLLGDARRGHVWSFDEPDDPADLSHTTADLRLFDASPLHSRDPDGLPPLRRAFEDGRTALLFDPDRLSPVLDGVPWADRVEPFPRELMGETAEAVARLFFLGSFGPADPVYLHPAVVGRVTSEV